MDNSLYSPADPQPDWGRLLPREAFQEIILTLRSALPPPPSDDPADLARRDRAAMAAVAALLPANGAEGRLAAQFVAADAWAMDCLLLAGERRREFEVSRKCRAQAMSLMREAKSALRVLLRLQAERAKMEADETAAGRAAWVEHGAVRMMDEALGAGRGGAERPDGDVAAGGDALAVAPEQAARPVSIHGTNSRAASVETSSKLTVSPDLAEPEAVGTAHGPCRTRWSSAPPGGIDTQDVIAGQ